MLVQHHTKRSPLSLQSSSEKRESRWDARLCHIVEHFLGVSSQSHIVGTMRESAGLDHRECDGWLGGLTTISVWNLTE